MSQSPDRISDPADGTRKMRRWLIDKGRFPEGAGTFDQAFVDKLLEPGFPPERFTTGIPGLHSLGEFSFKGVGEKRAVYAPDSVREA